MINLLIIILIAFSEMASADVCNHNLARKIAIDAVNEKYPNNSYDFEKYEIFVMKKEWVFLKNDDNKLKRGGGKPEVVINPVNCKVTEIELSR